MSLLRLFQRRPNFADGLTASRNTPDAILIDVRTTEEYAGGHIPGSVSLPLDRISSIKLDKSHPLFVYCQSGARSGQACVWLKRQGYTVTNIGGIAGYRGILE
jgi:phage shock protein E